MSQFIVSMFQCSIPDLRKRLTVEEVAVEKSRHN